MKVLQKYVYLIPIIQIIATFVVSFFDLTNNYWLYLGNSVGYSVLTSLVYVVYFWSTHLKFCLFTKLSAIGLLLMAIYNLIAVSLPYEIYTYIFDRTIFIITLVLTVFLPNNNDR